MKPYESNQKLICVLCPIGCTITISKEQTSLHITGYTCNRGKSWAEQEIIAPQRVLCTSLLVSNGDLPLVSVKTDTPIPLSAFTQLMRYLNQVHLEAPIEQGEILFSQPLGINCRIIATRKCRKKE